MNQLFYLLLIKLYPLVARIISPFNKKARLWIEGRKNIFKSIASHLAKETRNKIWIHCSSLGEFEQGLPLMEALKKQYPSYALVLTFFSPSGYEHEKNNKVSDYVFYMPMDSPLSANKFLEIVDPKIVIFIKYEFWYYYLHAVQKKNIPLLLVSAIFRIDQPFFKWYGNFHRKMLHCFSHIFVQDNSSMDLLKTIMIDNVSISGDTRFDRVIDIATNFKSVPFIEQFCDDKKIIVAGSTWLDDDEALAHYANTYTNYRFIIAPHNIDEDRIQECDSLYKNAIRYSVLLQEQEFPQEKNVLIIDNIGMLKYLYRYASICYVGGGFGEDGVHNVLEAAVYNKPVVFGPEYEKYIEAKELIECNGAFDIENALELEEIFNDFLTDENFYAETAKTAGEYVHLKAGATKKIITHIQEKRLLTI